MHLKEHERAQGPGRAVAAAKGHVESPQRSASKAGPVLNLVSFQILFKPPSHHLACGKKIVHIHFISYTKATDPR